jgi:hypothetical protein
MSSAAQSGCISATRAGDYGNGAGLTFDRLTNRGPGTRANLR